MTKAAEPALGRWGPGGRSGLAVIGLVVVAAGLLLPQLMPDTTPPRQATAAKVPEQPGDYQPPAWPEAPDPRALLLRLVVGTVVVLALCVVVLRLCRRWLTGMPGSVSPGRPFRLVDSFSLGNRCCLHLVRVGKREVLVGVDAGGMKAVIALTDSFEAALGEFQKEDPESGPLASAP